MPQHSSELLPGLPQTFLFDPGFKHMGKLTEALDRVLTVLQGLNQVSTFLRHRLDPEEGLMQVEGEL